MKQFTVYNPSTGEILRTGSCPDDQYDIQAYGLSIVEGIHPPNEFYWDHGFVPMPPKPPGFCNFDYTTKQWVLNTAYTIYINKEKRNALLQGCDWTQLPDVALTEQQKAAWAVYRQQLRDMTDNELLNNNFPTPP